MLLLRCNGNLPNSFSSLLASEMDKIQTLHLSASAWEQDNEKLDTYVIMLKLLRVMKSSSNINWRRTISRRWDSAIHSSHDMQNGLYNHFNRFLILWQFAGEKTGVWMVEPSTTCLCSCRRHISGSSKYCMFNIPPFLSECKLQILLSLNSWWAFLNPRPQAIVLCLSMNSCYWAPVADGSIWSGTWHACWLYRSWCFTHTRWGAGSTAW